MTTHLTQNDSSNPIFSSYKYVDKNFNENMDEYVGKSAYEKMIEAEQKKQHQNININKEAINSIPVVPDMAMDSYNELNKMPDWYEQLQVFTPSEIEELKAKGKMGIAETWQKKKKWELVPFAGTSAEATLMVRNANTLRKIKNGQEVSNVDKELLVDFLRDAKELEIRGGHTFGGGAIDIISSSIPYMIEFGLGIASTEGGVGFASLAKTLSTIGAKKAAKKAVQSAVQESLTKGVMTGAKKGISKETIKSIYDTTYNQVLKSSGEAMLNVGAKTAAKETLKAMPKVVGSTVKMSATRMPQAYVKNAADRQLSTGVHVTDAGVMAFDESEPLALSILKAFGETTFDNLTETAGWMFAPVTSYFAKPLRNLLPKKFFSGFEKLVSSHYGIKAGEALKKYGYDNVLEEMGEELLNRFLCQTFGINGLDEYNFDGFMNNVLYANDPAKWGKEALSFALMGGAGHVVVGSGSKAVEVWQKRKNEEKAKEIADYANMSSNQKFAMDSTRHEQLKKDFANYLTKHPLELKSNATVKDVDNALYKAQEAFIEESGISAEEFYLDQGFVKIKGSQSLAEQKLREKFKENGIDEGTADEFIKNSSELEIRNALKGQIEIDEQDASKKRQKAVERISKGFQQGNIKDKRLADATGNLVVTMLEKASEVTNAPIEELIEKKAPKFQAVDEVGYAQDNTPLRSIDARLEALEQEFNNLSQDENFDADRFNKLENEYNELMELRNQTSSNYDFNANLINNFGMSAQELTDIVKDDINNILQENNINTDEFNLEDIKVFGSYTTGKNKNSSDLDFIVQYSGSMREDDAFNMLNSDTMSISDINGKEVNIDINPINSATSGTIADRNDVYYQIDNSEIGNKIAKTIDRLKTILRSKKISELTNEFEFFNTFSDELKDAQDYYIDNLPESYKSGNTKGVHVASAKAIYINFDAIGNDFIKFIRTLAHEAKHATQEKIYKEVKNKKKKTKKDWEIIRNYNFCAKANEARQDFYRKNKKILDKIFKNTRGLSQNKKDEYFKNLKLKELNTYNEYTKLYEKYYNSVNEVEARKAGDNAKRKAENLDTGLLEKVKSSYGRFRERYVGTGFRNKFRRNRSGRRYQSELEGNKLRYFQSAYHGSPYKFDEFSTDFMGKGEGAQAHGWGLYFAKDKKISEKYRLESIGYENVANTKYKGKKLNSDYEQTAYWRLKRNGLADALRYLDARVNFYQKQYDDAVRLYPDATQYIQDRKDILDACKNLYKSIQKAKVSDIKIDEGQLYKVDVPEKKYLLDEQKTFSQQTKTVQKAIQNIPAKFFDMNEYNMEEMTGEDIYGEIVNNIAMRNSGEYTSQREYEEAASKLLNRYGIKGITYDGKQDGRCYVVFDDKTVKVLEKYYQEDKNNNRNLVMTHSARVENLDDIIESQSLIAPSMAITNKNQDTLNDLGFGEVIFVRNPDRIDFRTDNIYDRDIYTPRMPRAVFKTHNGYDSTIDSYEYDAMERLWKNQPEVFKQKYYGMTFDEYFKNADKVLFQGYTPAGYRKYAPYNAANIIKEMKKQGLQNGEMWGYGLSSFLATLAKKQKNMKQLKKSSVELGKVEKEVMQKLKDQYSNIENDLRAYAKDDYKSYTMFTDIYPEVLNAIANNNNSVLNEYMDMQELQKSDAGLLKDVKDFIATALSANRTYFEAKPMREVPIDEFSAVLVSDKVTDEQKAKLRDLGLEVVEYETGKAGEALNKFKNNNIFFQNDNDIQKEIRKIKGSYIPTERIIELFKDADESTIVHELAHWYLDLINEYAQYSEELTQDLEKVRAFLKNDGGEFTREQHEKFARAFEAYIRTGYARNNRLKKIFEDFKNWLISIYDDIKKIVYTENGVDKYFTDDEVKTIQNLFDRLLTSEKERIKTTVFDKVQEVEDKINAIKENEKKELDELDRIYKDNISALNRKSDKKRSVQEYLDLADKMTSRETKEVKEFKKRFKEATLDILSTATGYDKKFIANSRNWEKVQFALENAEDKITISGFNPEWSEFYSSDGVTYENDEIGGDYNLASQAFKVLTEGTYNKTFDENYEFEDINKFSAKVDYLAAKVKTLKGDERSAAVEAMFSLFNEMPSMPDEVAQDLLKKVTEVAQDAEDDTKEDYNSMTITSVPIIHQLQFYVTQKLNDLKVYNPETRYKMRINKSHRLYRYIKDIKSINSAKKQIRRINEFIIDDMRNNQRSLLHKEIQKQIKVNSKLVKSGTISKGKFDWRTNTVFAELVELNKLKREDAEAQLGAILQIQDAAKGENRDSFDENETAEFNKTNNFQQNLKNKFIQYRSMKVQDLDVEHTILLLQDILELKEKGRQAKSEQDFINKTQKWNTRNNLLDILEVTKQSGAKFGANWVAGVGKGVSLNGGTLANWESLLNSIFNKDTAQKYSLLLDEANSDIYARKHILNFYQRAFEIYGFRKPSSWDRFLDYDDMQPIIKLFQDYDNEKYTYVQKVFSINSPEGFARSSIEISKSQMITMFAWSLNEKLEQRLFNQFGVEQIRDMFEDKLSDEDKELAWALIDTCEDMRDDINEVFINTTGLSLPKVENYFPSKAERVQSDLDLYHDNWVKSSSPSFIKERKTCNRIPMKPLSPLEILIPHINKTAKYVVMSEHVNFLNQVFKDTAIKTKMQEIWGSEDGAKIYQTLINKLAACTFTNYSKGTNLVAGALDTLSRNYITSAIGFSPKVALGQLLSVVNYAENMPAGVWAKGFIKTLAHPVENFKYMLDNCEYLQTRLAGNSQNEVIAILTSEKDRFRTLRNFMTSNVKWGDIIAITLGGKPYVDYLIEQGMNKEDAFNLFVENTLRAQQAGTTSSISEWQSAQAKNCLTRMFFAFRNTDMQYERKFIDTLIQGKKGEIGKKELIKKIFIYKILNPFMFTSFLQNMALIAFFRGIFAGDDPDEVIFGGLRNAIEAIMLGGLNAYGFAGFIASSVVESIIAAFDKEFKHFEKVVPVMSDFDHQVQKYLKGDLDFTDYVDALAIGSEYALGIPTTKVVNTVEGVGDVAQGNVGVGLSRMAGWGRYTATKAWTGKAPKKR